MPRNSTTKATALNDTELDAVHAGSSRPRTSTGFSDVSGLGHEVNYAEYREGSAKRSIFMADIYNEPHD